MSTTPFDEVDQIARALREATAKLGVCANTSAGIELMLPMSTAGESLSLTQVDGVAFWAGECLETPVYSLLSPDRKHEGYAVKLQSGAVLFFDAAQALTIRKVVAYPEALRSLFDELYYDLNSETDYAR